MNRRSRVGRVAVLPPPVNALAAATPYAAALRAQHEDELLSRNPRRHFGTDRPDHGSKVWLTDTFGDINGVARTVETVARLAVEQGRDLSVVTCRGPVNAPGVRLRNFKPIAEFPWPGYKDQLGSLPPFIDMVTALEEMAPGEIILSTPGPVGLVGLYAARTLGCRVTGIYHTDFPAYIKHLLGGPGMGEMTWSYMRWFYGGMDRVYVRSAAYGELLAANGFERRVLRVMPRGVDTSRFSPDYRDRGSWGRDEETFRFLYVGRVSKEKNLDALLHAFDDFLATGRAARLVVVGDGPYFDELLAAHGGRRDVRFTGILRGEELATAYASADLFVFPSKTDTLGNVVLEAAASGVPAVVSDQGGPQELVRDGVSGLVVDVDRDGALVDAMIRLYEGDELRQGMGEKALEMARGLSWDTFLADLWREETAAERVDEMAEAMGGGRVARIG